MHRTDRSAPQNVEMQGDPGTAEERHHEPTSVDLPRVPPPPLQHQGRGPSQSAPRTRLIAEDPANEANAMKLDVLVDT